MVPWIDIPYCTPCSADPRCLLRGDGETEGGAPCLEDEAPSVEIWQRSPENMASAPCDAEWDWRFDFMGDDLLGANGKRAEFKFVRSETRSYEPVTLFRAQLEAIMLIDYKQVL